ncbi:molybdopterin-guanine dinucleotide biosynthesis protein B [Paenibacillus sp. YIM B09110]|uniref:molybdopterin-guanine dinucleotide biosynthesis protein B n=1 Tax=Paenibacillus sp. YIM B09110 TaxID=3126102 RepID=UPI00301CBF8E
MNNIHPRQLIIQIVGYKNTGKTTMVCRLTELFKQAGYVVGTIKHDAHHFQMDTPGTDTWKHQQAGADITAITSPEGTAILKSHSEPLEQLIAQMPEAGVILIEGFKLASYPKLVLLRTLEDLPLLELTSIIGIAAWPEAAASIDGNRLHAPLFDINHNELLFQFILQKYKFPAT